MEKKLDFKRDTIMFMAENKANKFDVVKEELIDKNNKPNNIFNIQLKKVNKSNVPRKSRQNSGLNVKAILRKQGNNKFLIEAREQHQR